MDTELVICVSSEAEAYQVTKALRALDDSGVIELYSATILAKTESGTVKIKDRHHTRAPWGTVLGVTSGALIGLLGGPVGVAVGAAVGGAAGLGGDLAYSGFAGDFVQDVGSKLQPGSFAVCASIWEDWRLPVDQELALLGAVVYRQATDDVITAQIRADWQQLKDEEAQLEAELKRASGKEKERLEAHREEVRARIATQRDRLKQRARELEEGWSAKVASIKAKAETAQADAKQRHEQHAEKLSRFAAAQKSAFRQLFA
jgi:uncharacterized membrane protein